MKTKITLGCGKDIRKGYYCVDLFDYKGIDLVWDLDKFPYPLPDNHFEEVIFENVIEHLLYPDKAIEEIHRICKNGAKVIIKAPHFSHPNIYHDLTHKRGLCVNTFNRYEPRFETGSLYDGKKTNFIVMKWDIEFSKLYSNFIPVKWFAHKFPNYYECFFAYIFPARALNFELEVVK